MNDDASIRALNAVLAAEDGLMQGRLERRDFLRVAAMAGIASTTAVSRAAFAQAASVAPEVITSSIRQTDRPARSPRGLAAMAPSRLANLSSTVR